MLTEKKQRQLAAAPKGNRSDAGSNYEQRRYLKAKGRTHDELMRQFVPEGPQGNSAAFRDGWDRIFGKAG